MRWLRSLRRRFGAHLKGPLLTNVLNVYPPYLGAGVRVRELGALGYEASIALRPWNRNYHGTHFGGSLYSMCDPFFALIVIRGLGPGYVVWDKAASIRYRSPGRGRVHARFLVSAERLAEIRAEVDARGRAEPVFHTEVRGEDGAVVAEVEKRLHVSRAKPRG